MNSDCKWFIAEAVFHATVQAEHEASPLVEDLLFLVQAVDHPSAVIKAEEIARKKEHSYDNEKGQRVAWTFVRLIELTKMIDQRFEEGAELKSTMTESEPRLDQQLPDHLERH